LVSVLYYYDEFSVKEISEMLNIAEGTIKSRLSRSREKIYNILKEEEGEKDG
jgi:RNA polymerase sigma-70 factor (ECF subfamily)